MPLSKIAFIAAAGVALVCATGCFRVSSDTRALRDAGLEIAGEGAQEQIELGVGFFTVGLAKLGAKFLELPPEAKIVMDSVRGAECSIYELQRHKSNLAAVLARADKAMQKRGRERILGVIDGRELVAVYIPRSMKSHRDLDVSVLVLNQEQLVCVSARGDMEPLLQVALEKAKEQMPRTPKVASAL